MHGSQRSISELVTELATSVETFHDRFGLVGPSSQEELLSRIPIQDEEVRELEHALLHETPESVAREAADVLYVAIGTLQRLDPSLMADAMTAIIEKNNSKTLETHHINAEGKVVRRDLP